MSARTPLIAAFGLVCAIAAMAAGIYVGAQGDAPTGLDIPLSSRLITALPLVIVGSVLLAVSYRAVPHPLRGASRAVVAVCALVVLGALYAAVDIAANGDETDETVFSFVAILTTFAPLSAVAVAASISGQMPGSQRVETWARVGGLAAVILTGAYVLWFHENRSYDTGGNWWLFLSLFAWGAGWGLALVALNAQGEQLQTAVRGGAAALIVFSVAYAWWVDGGRDESLFVGRESSRLLSLGLIVLVLAGVRLGWLGIAIGTGLILVAIQQNLDRAQFAVPGFEESVTVFIQQAGLPMAMGALLALISALWPLEARLEKSSGRRRTSSRR
jgi:hypothetical protein